MHAILRPLALLSAALPFAAPLAAQHAAPTAAAPTPFRSPAADAALPASTYAAVRFGGLAACREATVAGPVASLVHDFLARVPELSAQQLEPRLAGFAQHLQQHFDRAGVRTTDVRAVLGRPMTLAVGRLSVSGMGPSIALVIETGEQKKSIDRLVQLGARAVARRAGGGESERVDIGGHTFHALTVRHGPSLFAGALGDLYVISNSRGFVQEIVDVAAGRQEGLTAATRLGELQAQLPAPALAALFVNAQRVLGALESHLPYEASDWAEALGVGALESIYWGSTAASDGAADLLHVGVGGSERGLFKALVAAPADLAFARACSPNTVMFASASCDVGAVIDALERVAVLLPGGMGDELRAQLQQGLSRRGGAGGDGPGVDTIVRAFGAQVGVALALEKGAVPKPELLVRIEVRDRDVVAGLLEQLEHATAQRGGLEWKTRAIDGQDVRVCSTPPQLPLQLHPCHALTDDALWLASDVGALTRALRQDEEASLSAQPDFAELAEHTQGASGVVHWRFARAVEIGWRTVETMVYPQIDARRDQLGFGSEALPDTEAMAQALGNLTTVYRVDDDGVTVQTRGVLTQGAWLGALGFALDELLARAGAKVY